MPLRYLNCPCLSYWFGCAVQAGFAKDDTPSLHFNTLVADTYPLRSLRPGAKQHALVGMISPTVRWEGEKSGVRQPVRRGVVTDFDDYEQIWYALFGLPGETNCR
eukprot:9053395-Pyramimonas_sp.AAC.1